MDKYTEALNKILWHLEPDARKDCQMYIVTLRLLIKENEIIKKELHDNELDMHYLEMNYKLAIRLFIIMSLFALVGWIIVIGRIY